MAVATRFILSNLRSDDLAQRRELVRYLEDHQHRDLRFRPPKEISRAAETGQCAVVLNNANIIACSLMYKFETAPENIDYSEIGTMRVTTNGFGLQEFIAKFHLIQLYFEEYVEPDIPNVFAVVGEGTASEHVLSRKVGMTAWSPPPALISERATTGVPFASDKLCLTAPRPAFEQAFSSFSAWRRSPNVFATPKGDGEIQIETGWFASVDLEGG